jgi:excisionase family DNA binding protein
MWPSCVAPTRSTGQPTHQGRPAPRLPTRPTEDRRRSQSDSGDHLRMLVSKGIDHPFAQPNAARVHAIEAFALAWPTADGCLRMSLQRPSEGSHGAPAAYFPKSLGRGSTAPRRGGDDPQALAPSRHPGRAFAMLEASPANTDVDKLLVHGVVHATLVHDRFGPRVGPRLVVGLSDTHTKLTGGNGHDQQPEDAPGLRTRGDATRQAGHARSAARSATDSPAATRAGEARTPTTASDRLLTIDEVAAYTQLPKFTLYKMPSERRGPRAARLGKHLRYHESDVDAWIRSKMDDWTDEGGGGAPR